MTTPPSRAIRSITHAAIRFVLLALFLLGGIRFLSPARSAAAVQAQNTGLQMKATAAYDGYFKYGEWLPVWVELQNQGDDLDGDIRIAITGSQGTLVFDAPVSLPSGSRKLVPVYVLPNNFSRELDVQLISKGKTVASAKAAVHPQPNISYFVGLLAPERGALSLLSGIRFPGQERSKILVDLTLSELPERAEGLRSFDLLIFNDTDTSRLTPAQAAALAGWVQRGGRLVIGGGAGAQQTLAGLPAEMLPFRLEGTSEVDIQALKPLADFARVNLVSTTGPFVVARADSAGGVHTLVGENHLPLVQEWTQGAGIIDYIALDLAGVPFNGWPGTQAFWETLIGPSGSYPDNMPFDMSMRQFRANSLTYPLSNIPSLDLPSVKGLSILLGIYILIIGPVNYLALRRLRRMQLAWVTIPVLTLLFAGGAFGIGYTMRGNDLILNKIALVEARPDGSAAVTSYMGLFSPRMQSYEVTVQGESLVSPMMSYDQGPMFGPNGAVSSGTGGEMVFVQDQPARVKGLSVNQWAMQSFMSEGTWQDFGKITGNLEIQNDVLVGKVRNESKYRLTDVVVTMQGRFARLGDMAPGEEKAVNMGLSAMQQDRFGPPLSYRLFQQQYPNGPMPRDIEQRMNIVSNVFENGPWAKMISSVRPPSASLMSGAYTGIVVFGWLDQAPPSVEVPNNRLSQRTTALVYTTLDYNLPKSGYLSLPTGLIPGSLTKLPPNAGTCGSSTSIQMMRGEAEFTYQVPGNLKDFNVNSLKLSIWRDNGAAPGMPAISFYNWQEKNWITIKDPIQGTNIVQKASAYVNESGVIRVQLASQSDTFGCIYLDLGLEAERAKSGG